jgi:phage terminase large subunit
MWDNMREWIRLGGCLPADCKDLHEELAIPEYTYLHNGKLQIESKDDIKKRGYWSPNLADALAMSFAYPVVVDRDIESIRRHSSKRTGNYNELDFYSSEAA